MQKAREYAIAVAASALFDMIVFAVTGCSRDYIALKIQECRCLDRESISFSVNKFSIL